MKKFKTGKRIETIPMIIKIKPTNEITKLESLIIYDIHKKKYFGTGFGRNYKIWEEDLHLPYHNGLSKKMHIYSSNNKLIEGYSISTQETKLNKERWSKLLECAVDSLTFADNKTLLLEMLKEITKFDPINPLFHFVEVNFNFNNILDLFYKADFKPIKNTNLLDSLINKFMCKPKIQIHESSNEIIFERPIKLTCAYPSIWLTTHPQNF